MKILGIDTATKFLCLGVYDGGKAYGYNLEVAARLSSLLSVTIKRVLDAAGLRIQDIDYFACGLGPGSFTGMRVGLATIKGLAWSLNKPVLGISTLEILAGNALGACGDRPVITALDAKRNLVYCGIFKKKNGRLRRVKPYLLLNEKEFLKEVRPASVVLGDAAGLYKEKLKAGIKGVVILGQDYWRLQPQNIIELALERIKEKRFNSALAVRPLYLYPKECQIVTRPGLITI